MGANVFSICGCWWTSPVHHRLVECRAAGPPTVLSQSQRVSGSECEAPDNPQTHSESSRAPSFKPLCPSLLFKHYAEHLFWSGAIVSDGPIMEICLKCFTLRPLELHRLHLLMCWACKQLLSPHFSATFLHNLVSPYSTCTLGHMSLVPAA